MFYKTAKLSKSKNNQTIYLYVYTPISMPTINIESAPRRDHILEDTYLPILYTYRVS